MSSQKNILIVGTGGVGAVFGSRFQYAGARVSVVCRSNFNKVKESGFTIRSLKFGNTVFVPDCVISAKNDQAFDSVFYDYVFVSTKSLPNVENPALAILPFINSPDTIIVLLQNGIGVEDPFSILFPNNPILSCVVRVNSTQIEPSIIQHGTLCCLLYNFYTSLKSPKFSDTILKEFDAFLKLAKVESIISPNIQKERWLKLAWNAAFGSISVLSGGKDGKSLAEDIYTCTLMRDTMREVFAVGHAVLSEPLVDGSIEESIESYVSLVLTRPNAVYPSMLYDYQFKRPMEHQVIIKNPIDLAEKAKVSTPLLKTLYALLISIEGGRL
ncbi:hypothetical protein BB561_003160 [Smittium simulii]|uniref:2-dehydropantoate 2-reductase n=1 Tax=Smittium simulii TaxID=133385 RepID=A0A2T9YMN2_9FUNG|nr:hypothetical protein BB561_003160 [Smittium simulii]